MNKEMWLLEKLRLVAEEVDFEVFYSIQYYPKRGELTLQGDLSISAIKVANEFGVNLTFNKEFNKMVGYNEDESLRIVLTE
jgi:hypothetical protein